MLPEPLVIVSVPGLLVCGSVPSKAGAVGVVDPPPVGVPVVAAVSADDVLNVPVYPPTAPARDPPLAS